MAKHFNLGDVFMTDGVYGLCKAKTLSEFAIWDILHYRYAMRDWGNVPSDDKTENDKVLAWLEENPEATGMTLGSYTCDDVKLWIITIFNGEHTYTTILLPEEY